MSESECTGDRACKALNHIEGCFALTGFQSTLLEHLIGGDSTTVKLTPSPAGKLPWGHKIHVYVYVKGDFYAGLDTSDHESITFVGISCDDVQDEPKDMSS